MGEQEDRAYDLADRVNGHPEHVTDALPELAAILRDPDDHYALAEAILALGHAWDPRATILLIELVDVRHPEPEVRLQLARALPGGSDEEPVRSAAIATLVQLTTDVDGDVRDWACFGLGQLDADSAEARDALAARLHDQHVDARCEALLALARTGDPRALAETVSRLSVDDPDDIRLLEVKAAGELADPALLPVLGRLELAWAGEQHEHAQALAYARTRCQPERRQLAPAVEARMLAMANDRLQHAGLSGALVVTGEYPVTVLLRTRADGSIDEAFGRHRVWDDTTPDAGELRVDLWIDISLARLT